MPIVPELDASAQNLNLRMTEGDPLNFQWIVPGAASWAGAYTFRVRIDADTLLELPATASVSNTTDALFVVTTVAAQAALVALTSGYRWDIQQTGGPTRYSGVLFVESQV
jgi:hypothetical protein